MHTIKGTRSGTNSHINIISKRRMVCDLNYITRKFALPFVMQFHLFTNEDIKAVSGFLSKVKFEFQRCNFPHLKYHRP